MRHSTHSTLLTVNTGQSNEIEIVLVREPQRYLVSVSDAEGRLHQVEFPYAEGTGDIACAEAMEWYDNVLDCVNEYLQHPSSESIRSLVSFIN